MPQENQVLRCYSCKVFQVHLVKKTRKWECKMCGSKQSLKKIYGRGSGKDCRMHVMKLNELQFSGSQTDDCSVIHESENELAQNKTPNVFSGNNTQIESKWLAYYDGGNEFTGTSFESQERENCHETFSSKFYQENGKAMDKLCGGTQKELDLELLENSHDGNDNPQWYKNVERVEGKPDKKHSVLTTQDYSFKNKSKWLDYINEEISEEKERMSENENEPLVVPNQGSGIHSARLSLKPQKPQELLEANNLDVLKQRFDETSSNCGKYSNNSFPEGPGTTMIKTCGEKDVKKEKPNIFNTLCDIDNLDDILDF